MVVNEEYLPLDIQLSHVRKESASNCREDIRFPYMTYFATRRALRADAPWHLPQIET